MNDKLFCNISKYEKLKQMLSKIQKCIDNKLYKEAYYKAAALLEFVNINILIKQFKVKLEDTSITNITKEYLDKDKELFMAMLGVNSEYNTLDMNEVNVSDIEYLISRIDYIVEYSTEKYGRLFN